MSRAIANGDDIDSISLAEGVKGAGGSQHLLGGRERRIRRVWQEGSGRGRRGGRGERITSRGLQQRIFSRCNTLVCEEREQERNTTLCPCPRPGSTPHTTRSPEELLSLREINDLNGGVNRSDFKLRENICKDDSEALWRASLQAARVIIGVRILWIASSIAVTIRLLREGSR
jgi:hypothetical protein